MTTIHIKTDDGITINYRSFGHGQPVVMIHGFGGYQQIWQEQIDPFVQAGYQVITYDQRGHGASGGQAHDSKMERLIKDLQELLTALKLRQPILIGHSMGASVAYGMMGTATPIKAIVAIDQSPKMLNTDEWPFGYRNAIRANYRLVFHHRHVVRETLNGVPKDLQWSLDIVKEQFPFDEENAWPLLRDHVLKDWRKNLQHTTIPTLLVTANQSPYFNGKFADKMVEANATHLQHVAIDQTGHVVMAEQPAKFNQAVFNYLNSLPKIEEN